MSILFATSSIADFDTIVGCVAQTSSTYFDNTYATEAIEVNESGSSNLAVKTLPSADTDLWLAARYFWSSALASLNGSWIAFYDTAFGATAIARIRSTFSSPNYIHNLEIYNGATYDTVLTFNNLIVAENTRRHLAVHLKLHDTTGKFEVYFDKALIASFTGDTIRAGYTQVNKFHLGNPAGSVGGSEMEWSEVIVAGGGEVPIDYRLKTHTPNANGANTAWTGDYTAIDETGINDADLITTAVANDKETYGCTDLVSGTTDRACRAVVVASRCKLGATGPQNLKNAVRVGGTDYLSSNVAGLTSAQFVPTQTIWETSPATSAKWTAAEINAMEIGVQAIA